MAKADEPRDGWPAARKPVPERADGTPEHSLLRELAADPDSGIEQIEPGRYRTTITARHPWG